MASRLPHTGKTPVDIVNHLQTLERSLLTNEVRKDAVRVGLLLADEFREYGSSGRVYSKLDIVHLLEVEAPRQLSLIDFEVSLLTPSIALATYRAVREVPGSASSDSLRSSLWVLRDERWQMLFHQGTSIPAAASE